MDMHLAVRLVDDFEDSDFHTRESCPGTVNGHKLIHIANQIQRRFLRKGTVKHLIFQEEGTRNIWYKNSMCDAGIVVMGFSLSRLKNHPNAVSMEHYAKIFIGTDRVDGPDWMEFRKDWLAQNDFVLVKQ